MRTRWPHTFVCCIPLDVFEEEDPEGEGEDEVRADWGGVECAVEYHSAFCCSLSNIRCWCSKAGLFTKAGGSTTERISARARFKKMDAVMVSVRLCV